MNFSDLLLPATSLADVQRLVDLNDRLFEALSQATKLESKGVSLLLLQDLVETFEITM
jgi:hypothetical protein